MIDSESRIRCKFCGMKRPEDIDCVNRIRPDYIGFIFVPGRSRYVDEKTATDLKRRLSEDIRAVGVFINEKLSVIEKLLNNHVIDMIQLHGNEDEDYIRRLRLITDKPVIQAFRIASPDDLKQAVTSTADHVLLDSGAGTGRKFEWSLLHGFERPFFLAGGLDRDTVAEAVRTVHPFAVDVSSGIESDGVKDEKKMIEFMEALRKESGV